MIGIDTIVSVVGGIGSKLIDRLWPDPVEAEKAKLELLKMQQTGELAQLAADTDLAKGQMAINVEEAKSENVFVAGWRPLVGWVCGVAFAYAAIVDPLMRFVSAVMFGYAGDFPVVDTTITMQVLFGILGLGALRTYEKKAGVAGTR